MSSFGASKLTQLTHPALFFGSRFRFQPVVNKLIGVAAVIGKDLDTITEKVLTDSGGT